MKLLLNRFFILLKRSLKRPINLGMLFVLLLLAVIYKQLPSSEKTLYIPVAVLSESRDPVIADAVDQLYRRNSIFHFYAVKNKEEMYNDISSGKANSGICIPAGYVIRTDLKLPEDKIVFYSSPATLLPSLCRDEVFNLLFRCLAPSMVTERMMQSEAYAGKDAALLLSAVRKAFDHYKESTEIFRLEDAYGTAYNALTREEKADIPIRKLCGLFIFAAGLVGISSYLMDKESKLYIRLRGPERVYMRLLHILSTMLPITVISYPVILITQEVSALGLLGDLALYILICCLYTLVLSLIVPGSRIYQKVLPVVLTLSVLLGGVIFDASRFDQGLRLFSMLFPPYYF